MAAKVWSALAVAAVVVVVTWGSGPLARPLDAGVVQVAPGLEVTPPAGWASTPVAAPAPWRAVELDRGPASVAVATAEGLPGSPADVLDAYVRTLLPARVRDAVAGQAGTLTLPSGRQALTLGYVGRAPDGTPVEGLLIATLGAGGGVVFDATAPHGSLVDITGDVRGILDTAVIS